MALSYTRFLCRRSLDFRNYRSLGTSIPKTIYTTSPVIQSTACESHDEKNMRLKRPMSPHLTIYQVQLTAMLSITHRATGVIMSGYVIFLGFGTLFFPGGIPCFLDMVAGWGLPSSLLFLAKAAIAYPFTYHYLNGIRHLAWDLGKFLTIKEVYTTGWAVVGLSSIAALILACL